MSTAYGDKMSTLSRSTNTAMSLQKLRTLPAALGPVLSSILGTVGRSLPVAAKILGCLLILVNMRSWPLVWHFRVFRPVFILRLRYFLHCKRNMFKSRTVQEQLEDTWLDSIAPIGKNPWETVVKYRSWASIDDSDFNGHLSNSSYAKTLDAARFKCALIFFPTFFRSGGWLPLAATHYHFIREIPMLSPYEVRVSFGAWDQKWMYVICKFVTKPKGKGKRKAVAHKTERTPPNGMSASENLFHASLRTPADDISSTGTPFPSETPMTDSTPENTIKALRQVTAGLIGQEEPDGATLHTVSVSQICFKVGRITVPPALVLATNGFSVPPTSKDGSPVTPYSHMNPPPHWPAVRAVMSKPDGGSGKKLAALFKNGWKDVPEGERWWEQALGGAVEEQRKANLAAMEALRRGMDGAKMC